MWFDEWEIKSGDSIPAKIEEGLKHSRILVLCMSANAFGSDWVGLERFTIQFPDPPKIIHCMASLAISLLEQPITL